MKNIVKSIFRQREIEKLYELKYYGHFNPFLYKNKDVGLSTVGNKDKILSDKVIGTYDIDIPMLEVGDEFFLHDIQEVVKVKSKMRSSDGSITYYIEDKVIETENTKKTYAECREKIEHWKHEEEQFNELRTKLKEFDDYKKKYKYRHRFFNIKN